MGAEFTMWTPGIFLSHANATAAYMRAIIAQMKAAGVSGRIEPFSTTNF